MLTKRQKATLDYIDGYMAASGGVAPSYAEIMAGIGLQSKGPVFVLVRQLEERGALRRLGHGRWRAMEVVRKRNVPLDIYTHANARLLMFDPVTGKVDRPLPPAGPNRPDG